MKIHRPQIEWKNNLPYSTEYDDIYFSPKSGVEESKFVFVNGNNLFKSWEEKKISAGNIVEIGFGTGLNFLLTWQKFKQDCIDNLNNDNHNHINKDNKDVDDINVISENKKAGHSIKKLNYFSIEKFPLNKTQLKRSLSGFPELKEFSDKLVNSYPVLHPGYHRLIFEEGRVTLTLLFMDVKEALRQFVAAPTSNRIDKNNSTKNNVDKHNQDESNVDVAGIHTWYLDGFNPSSNLDVWNDEVYKLMASVSVEGSTLSTFTSAGHVRRGLEKADFVVKKVPGFGKKRERIQAVFVGEYTEHAGDVITHSSGQANVGHVDAHDVLANSGHSNEAHLNQVQGVNSVDFSHIQDDNHHSIKSSASPANPNNIQPVNRNDSTHYHHGNHLDSKENKGNKTSKIHTKNKTLNNVESYPWFYPQINLKNRSNSVNKTAIIGAGLAGSALAEAFTRREVHVDVFEKNDTVAGAASGNPRGVFFPVLHQGLTAIGRLSMQGYLYLSGHLERLKESGFETGFVKQGLLQVMESSKLKSRLLASLEKQDINPEIAREVILLKQEKSSMQTQGRSLGQGINNNIAQKQSQDNSQDAMQKATLDEKSGVKQDVANYASSDDISEIAKLCTMGLNSDAIHFPQAGSVSPVELCKANLDLSKQRGLLGLYTSTNIKEVKKVASQWLLVTDNGTEYGPYDNIVLANSYDIQKFSISDSLPIQKSRGQLFTFPENEVSRKLKCPVSGLAYIIPTHDGQHVVGATHDHFENDEVIKEQNTEMAKLIVKMLPELRDSFLLELLAQNKTHTRNDNQSGNQSNNQDDNQNDSQKQLLFNSDLTSKNVSNSSLKKKTLEEKDSVIVSRVAYRSAAIDHTPLIGPLANVAGFEKIFSGLKNGEAHCLRDLAGLDLNKLRLDQTKQAWHEGAFVLSGLGSRGMIYAHLGAEIIASMACGEPLAVEDTVFQAISPSRFMVRSLKRKGKS